MTTAQRSPATSTTRLSPPAVGRSAGLRRPLLTGLSVAVVLLGSQTLAASTSLRSDVRLLLPSEGLLAGLGDGLRRGYGRGTVPDALATTSHEDRRQQRHHTGRLAFAAQTRSAERGPLSRRCSSRMSHRTGNVGT